MCMCHSKVISQYRYQVMTTMFCYMYICRLRISAFFSPGKIWESCAWCARPSLSNSSWESSTFHSTEWEGTITAFFYLCPKICWLAETFMFTRIKSFNTVLFCQLFSGPLGNVDILVVNERLSGNMDKETGEQLNVALHSLFWSSLMAGLLNKWYLPELCPSALQYSWPSVFNRLLTVYSLIDSGYEHVIIFSSRN